MNRIGASVFWWLPSRSQLAQHEAMPGLYIQRLSTFTTMWYFQSSIRKKLIHRNFYFCLSQQWKHTRLFLFCKFLIFFIFFFKSDGIFINMPSSQFSKGMIWSSVGEEIMRKKVGWHRVFGRARFSSILKSHNLNWTLKRGVQVSRYGAISSC